MVGLSLCLLEYMEDQHIFMSNEHSKVQEVNKNSSLAD
jgi:hypothetical protein